MSEACRDNKQAGSLCFADGINIHILPNVKSDNFKHCSCLLLVLLLLLQLPSHCSAREEGGNITLSTGKS